MNGAPSHVDTFDPKPALAKHEGDSPSEDIAGKEPRGRLHAVAVQVFRTRRKRRRDERAVSEACSARRRSLRGAFDAHRCAESRTRIADDAVGTPATDSAEHGFVVVVRTGHRRTKTCRRSSPCRPVCPWSDRNCGRVRFCRANTRASRSIRTIREVDKLIANVRHPRLSGLGPTTATRVAAQTERGAFAEPRRATRRWKLTSVRWNWRSKCKSEATRGVRHFARVGKDTRESYGDTEFGRSCLLGRRLLERGVRVVQVFYVKNGQKQPWDTHRNNNESHKTLCADTDRATAALLTDLKSRGMLDDTLVIWGGEFGRTPYAQVDKSKDPKKAGRDHHHTGFSMLLAGGGIRGGLMYGATDEFGMHAVENRVHVHDLHATVLHLDGHRPHATDVPLLRTRLSSDRCAWPRR